MAEFNFVRKKFEIYISLRRTPIVHVPPLPEELKAFQKRVSELQHEYFAASRPVPSLDQRSTLAALLLMMSTQIIVELERLRYASLSYEVCHRGGSKCVTAGSDEVGRNELPASQVASPVKQVACHEPRTRDRWAHEVPVGGARHEHRWVPPTVVPGA